MQPKLVIQHHGDSSLAGQTQTFEQESIRLGRRPDSDVQFDANRDLSVSGNHAEVRIVGGRAVITDNGSSNGTFVNGKRISTPTPLSPSDRVSFGEDGPQFTVTLDGMEAAGAHADEGDSPSTVVGTAVGDAATIRQPKRPAGKMPTIRPFDSPAAPPAKPQSPLLSPAPPAAQGATVRQAPPHQPPVPQHQQQPGEKRLVGINTLMGVVHHATSAERRRMLRIIVPIAILAVVATGLILTFVVFGPEPQAGSAFEWKPVIAQVEPSVYVVIVESQTAQGPVEAAGGTAWSVAPGKLATNAHVAQVFLDLKNGQRLFARSTTTPPHDLRITEVQQHPGWKQFEALEKQYLPVDPAKGVLLQYFWPCDVALLIVDDADKDKQSAPLTLVGPGSFASMASGDPVMTSGFPVEGKMGGGVDPKKPQPSTAIGTMSKITDAFLSKPDTIDDGYHLTYQFEVTGGASGSPVFNNRGEVIGLVAGGDVVGAAGSARLAVGGNTFGPRSDLVQELLDGVADERTRTRTEQWRQRFESLYQEGVKDAERFARIVTEVKGNASITDKWSDRLTAAGKGAAKVTKQFTLNGEGEFSVGIVAHGFAVALKGEIDQGRGWNALKAPPVGDLYFNILTGIKISAGRRAEFKFRLWADDAAPFEATDISVFVFKKK